MIKFYIAPGYDVRKPEREFGNAGIDVFIPNYTEDFANAFNEKNSVENATLNVDATNAYVRIAPHGRANIPSGLRSYISTNIALEAQNKSGIATKTGLIYGAATVDASYKGIIHISLINTTDKPVDLPLGMKIIQLIPRFIDISDIAVYDDISLDEFYKGFKHDHRGEGGFGSTGV